MNRRENTAYLIDSCSLMCMWVIVRSSCLGECGELQDTIAGGLGGPRLAGSSRAYWRLPRFLQLILPYRCRTVNNLDFIQIIGMVVRIVQENGSSPRVVCAIVANATERASSNLSGTITRIYT